MERAWLPRTAMQDGALGAALSAGLQAWALDWLARTGRPVVETSRLPTNVEVGPPGGLWGSRCGALVLHFELSDPAALGRVLAAVPNDKGLTRDEESLLAELAGQALEALTNTLLGFFALPRDAAFRSAPHLAAQALAFRVRFGPGLPDLRLIVDEGCAISARKRLAQQNEPATPLADRESVIAHQVIPIGARFNSTTIPLTAFKTLSCGDVIVLDHHCDRPLALTVNMQSHDIACDLLVKADHLALRIANA